MLDRKRVMLRFDTDSDQEYIGSLDFEYDFDWLEIKNHMYRTIKNRDDYELVVNENHRDYDVYVRIADNESIDIFVSCYDVTDRYEQKSNIRKASTDDMVEHLINLLDVAEVYNNLQKL